VIRATAASLSGETKEGGLFGSPPFVGAKRQQHLFSRRWWPRKRQPSTKIHVFCRCKASCTISLSSHRILCSSRSGQPRRNRRWKQKNTALDGTQRTAERARVLRCEYYCATSPKCQE